LGDATPPPAAGLKPRQEVRATTDDVIDPDDELTRWPLLADRLRVCREMLAAPYREVDAQAMRQQSIHKLLAWIAAVCGTIAVLLAIVQLAVLSVHVPAAPPGQAAANHNAGEH
jgi:hypothetical protein